MLYLWGGACKTVVCDVELIHYITSTLCETIHVIKFST